MMRNEKLIIYIKELSSNGNGKELYEKYKEEIEKVTPRDAFVIFNYLIDEGMSIDTVLKNLDKVINVFYKNLKEYKWEKPEIDTFSNYLIKENEALIKRMEEMKEIIKNKSDWFIDKKFNQLFNEVKDFHVHYTKKENILFPIMEKKNKDFNGLKIMWALHDEGRKSIKEFNKLLLEKEYKDINEAVGKLFFVLYGLVQKEELILFPVVSEMISSEEEKEMLEQSLEYDYFIIEKPVIYHSNRENEISEDSNELSLKRYLMIFDSLPVDLTYVDENNKVRYFNKPKDRFFPRSQAIIGRDVENCHPPDSVHVVLEIIESFRNGERDTAKFWINLKGKTLLIEYFAIRDGKGIYRGVLEVSQEISEIQKLTGEKRLLEWD
ncbi:MAG: PAS domain-containing protein [Eubacteriales bacterium]|nr:PAS domain-containing protein [Eubacteriales bacterium]